MNTIEQQSIQKQRLVHETPPVATFVQVLPYFFGGFILFSIVIAVMPLVWDHGGWIGRYIDVVICILITLAAGVVVVRFYTIAGTWWHGHYNAMLGRNIVQAGDVVIRVHPDGTYDHLSAEHESAKLLAMPKDEPVVYEVDYQQRVKQLKEESGWGRGRIAKELKMPEAHVRKILENMGVKEEYE